MVNIIKYSSNTKNFSIWRVVRHYSLASGIIAAAKNRTVYICKRIVSSREMLVEEGSNGNKNVLFTLYENWVCGFNCDLLTIPPFFWFSLLSINHLRASYYLNLTGQCADCEQRLVHVPACLQAGGYPGCRSRRHSLDA